MKSIKNWNTVNNSIEREFTFKNFVDAVEFVTKIVPIAEGLQHHPDIDIYGYKNVRIKLTTHDAGNTVTQKDLDVAAEINDLVD